MKKAIGGCVLVIAVFAGFAYLILMNEDRLAEEGQAKAGVGQITAAFGDRLVKYPAPNTPPSSTAGWAPGRLLVLDASNSQRAVDLLHMRLPPARRADTPADVGTVVYLYWQREEVGKYPSGGTAYVQTCDLAAVDLSGPRITAYRKFRGGPPPETVKMGSGNHEGPRPEQEVVEYLTALPSRPAVAPSPSPKALSR
jgi:hypothetical protein